jgi:serine/threonine protein kinase
MCPACVLEFGLIGLDSEADAPEDSAPVGRIFGDFELLEEVAAGGMGVVYRARQRSLNRIVAVKMIRAGHLARAADIRRFRTESEAAAKLQHPNIVAVHEVGEHDGQHYFSMDFVDGPSLDQLVREHPLPPADAARCVKTVAEAIHFAHDHGVLHRDLKPSNVMLGADGTPRVMDFGLAKLLVEDSEATQTGVVMGSPGYMPPEQALGKAGEITVRFSTGAIVPRYEALYERVIGASP